MPRNKKPKAKRIPAMRPRKATKSKPAKDRREPALTPRTPDQEE